MNKNKYLVQSSSSKTKLKSLLVFNALNLDWFDSKFIESDKIILFKKIKPSSTGGADYYKPDLA